MRFNYVTRPDQTVAYESGLAIHQTQLLDSVETFAPYVDGPVRTYQMTYTTSPASNRSLLASVRECDFSGVCRSPVEFEWASSDALAGDTEVADIGLSTRAPRFTFADIDGDGSHELVAPWWSGGLSIIRRDPSFGWLTETIRYDDGDTAVPFDLDDDGVEELALLERVPGDSSLLLEVELRVASTAPSGHRTYVMETMSRGEGCDGPTGLYVGGFNERTPGTQLSRVCRGGVRAVTDFDGDAVHELSEIDRVELPDEPALALVDIDGDGLLDELEMPRLLLDVNGDGLTDVLGMYDVAKPLLWLNTGNVFLPPVDALTAGLDSCVAAECEVLQRVSNAWQNRDASPPHPDAPFLNPLFRGDLRVTDLNGDGRSDMLLLLAKSNTGVGAEAFAYISDGTGFRVRYFGEAGREGLLRSRDGWPSTQVADLDGDGAMDLLYADFDVEREEWVYVARFGRGVGNDLLVDVRRARRSLRTFDYESLQQSGHVPLDEADCPDALRCVRSGRQVVVQDTDEYGRTFSHHYEGALADMQGYGWLGFAKHVVEEPSTRLRRERRFDQSFVEGVGYPFVGRPVAEIVTTSGADAPVRIELAETTYELLELSPSQPHHMTVVTAMRNRVFETSSWTCEDCDAVKDARALPSDFLIRDSTDIYRYDGIGNLSYEEHFSPESTHVWATYTLENRASAYLLGLRTQVQDSSYSDAEGFVHRVRTATHDTRGLIETDVNHPFDPELLLKTAYVWDEFGLLRQVTQSDAFETSREAFVDYDAEHVHPETFTNAVGHVAHQVVHPANGELMLAVDPNGLRTERRVDGFGRETRLEGPDTLRTRAYVRRSRQLLRVDERVAGAPEVRTEINDLEQVVRRRRGAFFGWFLETFQYDDYGRVRRIIHPRLESETERSVSRFFYDSRGQITRVRRTRQPDINVTHEGRVQSVTIGSLKRSAERDLGGRLVTATTHADDVPQRLDYVYGAFDNLLQTKDHEGFVWSSEFDIAGRRIASVDPDAGLRKVEFSAFSDMERILGPAGEVLHEQLVDALGRPTTIKHIEDGETDFFVWDTGPGAVGRLSNATRETTDAITQVDLEYDPLTGRQVRETTSMGEFSAAIDYAFDDFGRLERITYPEVEGTRTSILNQYDDSNGYLWRVIEEASEDRLWEASRYDALGRVSEETFHNGVTTTREFDSYSYRPRSIVSSRAGETIQDYSYSWSPLASLEERNDNRLGRRETFEYDALNRLERWETDGRLTGDYDYDQLGNITRASRDAFDATGTLLEHWETNSTFDGPTPHRATTVDGEPTAYDARGRWTGASGWSATFNSMDLPTEVVRDSGSTRFAYDAFNRRVAKADATGGTFYAGRLYEVRSSNAGQTHVLHVMGAAREIAQIRINSLSDSITTERQYLHDDHQGSIESITDESGVVVERNRYAPYGQRLDMDGTPLSESGIDRGYTSHRHDASTGFIDMGARTYDPATGRFLSVDPRLPSIVNRQAYNPFSYVLGDPMTFTDPSGMFPCDGPEACYDVAVAAIPTLLEIGRWLFRTGRAGSSSATDGATRSTERAASAPRISDAQAAVSAVMQHRDNMAFWFAGGAAHAIIGATEPDGGLAGHTEDEQLAWQIGQAFGSGAMTLLDASMVASGLATIMGGGGAEVALIPATNGASAPAIPATVASGFGQIAAGGAGLTVHVPVLSNAHDNIVRMQGEGQPPPRAEARLRRGGKHGVGWREGPARATRTDTPQGQFGSQADVDFVEQVAAGLQPGEHTVVPLPAGHTSVVHLPEGHAAIPADGRRTVSAVRVWVRRNKSGTVHAYPRL